MLKMVTASRFKSLNIARTGAAGRIARRSSGVPMVGIRKQSTETVTVESEGDRTLRFTISTGVVDRDRDTISVAGWQLDAFRKNPVVLWAHNAWDPPVGRALEVGQTADRLSAAVQFLDDATYGDASKFADAIYKLARDGYLSATSVGFRPIEWDFTDDETRGADDWWPGIDFHTQELCEFSIVTVPSNPEALIEPDMPLIADAGTRGHANEEATTARERRRRVFQLVQTVGGDHAAVAARR
jgi:HK97 family phage prohead protease